MAEQLALTPPAMERWATLSHCGTYRYILGRRWNARPALPWVMLNPSTADAEVDDNTIRRVVRFSRDAGYGAAIVANLYALRATDPAELARHRSPVGPVNDGHLTSLARVTRSAALAHDLAPLIVVAWGSQAPAARAAEVLDGPLAGMELRCLGVTKDGHPRHPLYVPASQPLEPYPGVARG